MWSQFLVLNLVNEAKANFLFPLWASKVGDKEGEKLAGT